MIAQTYADNLLAIAKGITEDVSGVESIMKAEGNQKKLQALKERYPDVYKDLMNKIEEIKIKLSSQGE